MIGKKSQLTHIAMFLAVVALPAWAHAQQGDAQRSEAVAPTSAPQRIELEVHGLSCPFCAYGLERKLKKIEGLDSLNIDFRTGAVLMLVRDGSKATDQRIRELVRDAGFEVAAIERRPREEIETSREDNPA